MNTILLVAEKPSVARRLSFFLSGQQTVQPDRQHQFSVYRFIAQMQDRSINFLVTHCIGHVTEYKFSNDTRMAPEEYFAAPIQPVPTVLGKSFRQLLKSLVNQADRLILCLDNDREGEHISYEVVESFAIFRKISIFPSKLPRVRRVERSNITDEYLPLQAVRMRFNALNGYEISRAFRDLQPLNALQVEAVDVRQQLDLRIGFALSHLQMMHKSFILRGLSGDEIQKTVLSFGTCQTPTLGLLHYNALCDLETGFLKLKTTDLDFNSNRGLMQMMRLKAAEIAQSLDKKPYVHIRGTTHQFNEPPPKPLNTVALQKKLAGQLGGRVIMQIAEELYTSGAISYPRTETEVFEKGFEFQPIIESIGKGSILPDLARYARDLRPVIRTFKGKTDHSHPPIHPVRMPAKFKNAAEQLVFDTICRAFLACLSQDCKKVTHNYQIADFDSVELNAQQTYIMEPGWREVYNERADDIPKLEKEIIQKAEALDAVEGQSQKEPSTERSLIEKMNQYGIGTDATISEHIQRVQDRKYVGKRGQNLCLTGPGLYLIRFYEKTNITAVATSFRAGIEAGLRSIESGSGDPMYIYKTCLQFAIALFRGAERNIRSKKLK